MRNSLTRFHVETGRVVNPESNRSRLLPERLPEVGEPVQMRSRRWLVEEVVGPEIASQSPNVRLACADEAVARILELNAERAREEIRSGVAARKAPRKARRKRTGSPEGTGDPFI
jgi:hypothetical protein